MSNAMNAAPASSFEPGLKEARRATAKREHRYVANMVEMLIRDYCGRNGVTIQKPRSGTK